MPRPGRVPAERQEHAAEGHSEGLSRVVGKLLRLHFDAGGEQQKEDAYLAGNQDHGAFRHPLEERQAVGGNHRDSGQCDAGQNLTDQRVVPKLATTARDDQPD